MKTIVSIVLAALLCVGVLLFGLSLAGRRTVRGAALSQGLESILASQAGVQDRAITLVLDDTSRGADPLGLPEPPSFFDDLRRGLASLLRKRGGDPEPTGFAEALSVGEPGAVVWSYDGFSTSDEPAMVQAVMEAIVKARESGARVNLVTTGNSALIAAKAVARLEGKDVRVESLHAFGMSKPALVRADPLFAGFERPSNLVSWTNTRIDRAEGAATRVTEHSSPNGSGMDTQALNGVDNLLKSSKDLADWARNIAPRIQKEIEERSRREAEEKARQELARRQESAAKRPAARSTSDCLLDPECAPVGETPEQRERRIQKTRSTAGAASNMDGKRGRATYASPAAGGEAQTETSKPGGGT
ncbi:MAG TPA: hypothetical protein DCM05_11850, partial [Elusimicrobia bacterium]|nr:hypothetical protein [Elusimicrobiota bacterium]